MATSFIWITNRPTFFSTQRSAVKSRWCMHYFLKWWATSGRSEHSSGECGKLHLRACHRMANLREKHRGKIANNVTWKIALRICVSCFARNCSYSMLNKIANRAYKAHTDWLNHFHSSREFKGYNVESQAWNLMWASLGAVISSYSKKQ